MIESIQGLRLVVVVVVEMLLLLREVKGPFSDQRTSARLHFRR